MIRRNGRIRSVVLVCLLVEVRLCGAFSTRRRGLSFPAKAEDAPDLEQTQLDLLGSFLDQVDKSLPAGEETPTFTSLTLRGPSKKALRKLPDDDTRGCIRLVTARMIELKKKKKTDKATLRCQVTFKYHLATDIAKNWKIEQVPEGLKILFGLSEDSDESVVPPSEWGSPPLAGSALGIQSATLETNQALFELDLKRPSMKKRRNDTTQSPVELNHDRTKKVPLAGEQSFFRALGVTNDDGKPRPGMTSKYRQCQKFVEILQNLVAQQASQSSCSINVVDMGCGRGYLTFALHSFLTKQYPQHSVQSRGIDVRPKLVAEISKVARSLGGSFDQLSFEAGTIQDFLDEEVHVDGSSIGILIALHACDTATDDALWSGITKDCDILVVAPCCHREVRPQVDRLAASAKDHPMKDVLKHNIYRERLAETVTDSVRALLLEIAGYSVQVFEFIGGEHTSKNVMITAVKNKRKPTAAVLEKLRSRLKSLASFHGIRQQKLAQFMGEHLKEEEDDLPNKQKMSVRGMPPLL